jgi:hypothetical protein
VDAPKMSGNPERRPFDHGEDFTDKYSENKPTYGLTPLMDAVDTAITLQTIEGDYFTTVYALDLLLQ